ncbi:MAG: tyrosine-type recombinase/integrase [Nanobdellota archaeon]
MADIHNYKQRLERTLKRIKDSKDISEHNRKLILNYYKSCIVEGLSLGKIERYVYDSFTLARSFSKDLDKATEEDLRDFLVEIENKDWSLHTKYTFKIGLRKFYKMIDKITEKGESPKRLKWMKTNLKKCQVKLPEDLLTEEEVELMVRHAWNKRDKALISCLYESGCRIGELCSLTIKDVRFDEYGAIMQVSGKTGSRVVRIVNSSLYLLEWINSHPSGDRNDFIWVSGKSNLLTDSRISNIIKECAKRAGIKKRIWCHGFRHASCSRLANYLTESQMKNYFGWTQSSEMAGVYVHLNGKDSDKAILKMNGVLVEEDKKRKPLEIKECLRCKTKNEPTNKFCKICGFVLDKEESEKIVKLDIDRQKADEVMNKLIQDPEILELIKRKLQS